ncbi:hypothetical protein TMPK1_25360 [Rhodospirillales bacterium TMPK1]|uniref:DUF465 domain-containing protein n=2 Tax=Roseiterribacter gracilis TaxID=2812848 RepID=A0A8S8XEG8_9PROT|nr:hypothetical protein TMPK1_25360 [Rhodospirillales bacterium TMPK1]
MALFPAKWVPVRDGKTRQNKMKHDPTGSDRAGSGLTESSRARRRAQVAGRRVPRQHKEAGLRPRSRAWNAGPVDPHKACIGWGRVLSPPLLEDTRFPDSTPMLEQEIMRRKLEELRTEHRDLDDVIARMAEDNKPFDQLQMQRLKKRKLILKDAILKIESRLLPDIIA